MSQPIRPVAQASENTISHPSSRTGRAVARSAPPAEQRERRGRRAQVQRRDLRVRDAEAPDQAAPIAEQERADAVGIDVARSGCFAQQLEPREQCQRREAECERNRHGRVSQSTRARAREQPEHAGRQRERGELLRAAGEVQREHGGQAGDGEAAACRPRARRGFRQRECRREPGCAAQQPERDRARDEMPGGGERDGTEGGARAARVQLPRQRVGAEARDQVVERRHGAQRVDRREQPRREQHRRIGHARLGICQERLARERPGRPERQVARRQAVVQEGRERCVERIRVGRGREPAAERQRREHRQHRDDHGGDGRSLAPHGGFHGMVTWRARGCGRRAPSPSG